MKTPLYQSVFCFLIFTSLTACGSSVGNSSDYVDNTHASISITNSRTYPKNAELNVYGRAFSSELNIVYDSWCLMISTKDECLSIWNSYPGVTVRWQNITTGTNGSAKSTFKGPNWNHRWDAWVPLVDGVNELQFTATDPDGRLAKTSLVVSYPEIISGLRANTDVDQITLLWNPDPLATAYRLY